MKKIVYWFSCLASINNIADYVLEAEYHIDCLNDENRRLQERVTELEKAIDWLTEREMTHH